jgi:hypothetical protein
VSGRWRSELSDVKFAVDGDRVMLPALPERPAGRVAEHRDRRVEMPLVEED